MPASERVRVRVIVEPDALASCEVHSFYAEGAGVACSFGYAGPVGAVGSELRRLAAELAGEGYRVTLEEVATDAD